MNVDTPGFSTGRAFYTSIAIDRNGIPYVVYSDDYYGQKAVVMMYNGSSWATVGSPGFSTGEADYTTIAIDNSGTPYVAYSDVANGDRITVMKYTGSSWTAVGSVGFSTETTGNISIAIDYSGIPYVAYADFPSGGLNVVMKYDGSSWNNIGSNGLSAGVMGGGSSNCLVIDGIGTPYIVGNIPDSVSMLGPAIVMKFDGSNWTSVGNAGLLSIEGMNEPSIAFLGDSIYIAYRDEAHDDKTTVIDYSTIEGVKSIPIPTTSLTLFPNPASTSLTITSPTNITNITITNLIGKAVYTHEYYSPQVNIDVAELPAGIYFVKVHDGSAGLTMTRKFVKE